MFLLYALGLSVPIGMMVHLAVLHVKMTITAMQHLHTVWNHEKPLSVFQSESSDFMKKMVRYVWSPVLLMLLDIAGRNDLVERPIYFATRVSLIVVGEHKQMRSSQSLRLGFGNHDMFMIALRVLHYFMDLIPITTAFICAEYVYGCYAYFTIFWPMVHLKNRYVTRKLSLALPQTNQDARGTEEGTQNRDSETQGGHEASTL